MLKIRLSRRGKKNRAFFRIVVAEHTSPVKGKFIEVLGFLNPHTKEKKIDAERITYWIEKGAQCSDSIHNLLVANGIIKGPKRAVKIKKKVEEKKEEAGEKKPEETGKAKEDKIEEKVEDIQQVKEKTEEKEEVKSEEVKQDESKQEEKK